MNIEMKQLYTSLLSKLEAAKREADYVLENYEKMSDKESESHSDEMKVYLFIQNELIENLEDSIDMLDRNLKKSIGSRLVYNQEFDRYSLACWAGDYGSTLSCGYPIEVLNEKWETNKDEEFRWYSGRVEHSNEYGGYYFYNKEGKHIPLKEGLIVRVRLKS